MPMHTRTPTRDDSEVGSCQTPTLSLWLTFSRYLDLPLLISWLAARQYAPEGGFSGRTNKLVDGCYSHWVGGCSPLVEAALSGPQSTTSTKKPTKGSLYSKEGLTRYILSCCQNDDGGLRDKPSTWVMHIANVTCTTNILHPDIQMRTTRAIRWQVLAPCSTVISTPAHGMRKRDIQ